MNLVVFFTDTKQREVFLQIVKRIFYRFGKTFLKSGSIFAGKSISSIEQARTGIEQAENRPEQART